MTEKKREQWDSLAPRFVEYVTYLVVRFLEEAICLIPSHEKALGVGRLLGRLAFVLVPGRRELAVENLTVAFGKELTPRQIRTLARKNFEHLGMLTVDFFRLRRWSQEELAERLIIGGAVNFNHAWSPGRRGVFYVTAHYGSFEVLAAVSRVMGLRATLVATPVKNRFVNRRMIFRRGGGDSGLNIVPHRGIVHKLIDELKAGGQAAVLADQRGDDTRPVWVTFFGRQVLANGVFARFAMDGDAYCYPVMGIRLDDGRYYCEFGDEIPIQITGDTDHDVRVNCQRFHDVFEKWLRERPEQGFWMHSKFKRRSSKRKKIARALQPTHVRHE